MSLLEVKADLSQLTRLANVLGAAGKNAPLAIARAVNHTGDKAKTQMIRTLTVQTGLKRQVIVRALKPHRATPDNPVYRIDSAGGNIALKYFGARETRAGVSAAPRGQRQTFAHTFMKAGWWPKRVEKRNWNNQVFIRAGGSTKTGMDKFEKVKSGVFIPDEMVTGATADAFRTVAERDLPDRLAHELLRALGA
jgi:hypothetical protein